MHCINPSCTNLCSTDAARLHRGLPRQAQSIEPREEIVRKAGITAAERQGNIFGLNENSGTNTLYVSLQSFREVKRNCCAKTRSASTIPVCDRPGSA